MDIYGDILNATLCRDPLAPAPVAAVPAPAVPACRCEGCRYGRRPATSVALYMGDDAVRRLELAAIRDGRYEDIDAGFDRVTERYRARFASAARSAERALEPVWRRIEAHLAEQTVTLPRYVA